MRKLIGLLGLSTAALFSACGGGGGSSGTTTERYSITLRADKATLPLNISHIGPGAGAYSPYTTTLYVHAKEGNDNIPGGTDIFECDVSGGLDNGALYYLNGEDEEAEDGSLKPSRSVVLGANSGGASFHFHAGDKAGTSRVTCTVTDPRDSRRYSASVDITVGAATGKPASVMAVAQEPGYLGTQFNLNGIRNNVAIQAFVMDDANQPVPNPTAPNLRVVMHQTGASDGARLLSGSLSGSPLDVRTVGGIGLISLSSGPNAGVILLELITDRFDNDVSNGLQDPVAQLQPISVVGAVASVPLSVGDASITAPNGALLGQALEATGGVPPYTWAALDGLPAGLQLSASGVLSGTPMAPPGNYVVRVRVTDGAGAVAQATVTIVVTGPVMVFTAPALSMLVGQPFSYALSASGGQPPLTWTALGSMPAGLSLNSTTGVISGTPTTAGTSSVAIRVADSAGNSVTANVAITVTAPATTP